MRKKTLLLLFTAAFTLCACASNGAGQNDDAVQDPAGEEESGAGTSDNTDLIDASNEANESGSEKASDESTADASDDSSFDTGFKKAYIEIIEKEQEKRESLSENSSSEDYAECITGYWLYDVDKDGVPELIVEYGSCEADYHGNFFTYADGEVRLISEIGMGHSSFYADPGENGILSYYGHMGYGECARVKIVDGELQYETLYTEDINPKLQVGEDVWYKAANEIVDGAYYLQGYSYGTTYPIESYDIAKAYVEGKANTSFDSYSYPEDNPDFYKDIMENDGKVNVYAINHNLNTLGEVKFSKLLEEGAIYKYTQGTLSPNEISYVDFNADGVYECVFYLVEESNPDGHDNRAIMTYQDGEVYVYLDHYPYDTYITEDGYFVTEPDEYINERYVKRILYNKEDYFAFSVPSEK